MLLMGLGQEGDREGEVVRWEAGASACDLVAMQVPKSAISCSQLTTSPSLSLSWPRPIGIKSELSQTVLILGDEAHSGSYHGSYGLIHARFTHRHRRHALPLHTCSNTTPTKAQP